MKICKNCGKDLAFHKYKPEHGSLVPYCENLKDKFTEAEPKETWSERFDAEIKPMIQISSAQDTESTLKAKTFISNLLKEEKARVLELIDGETLIENPNKIIPADIATYNLGYNKALDTIKKIIENI